ncbi:hypothetical protein SAMN05444166_4921 [Singulisphaera sp. GP187]|nr:hypothetical protein SAMN05444166_4921 [Singulisphaera sp. GP187]
MNAVVVWFGRTADDLLLARLYTQVARHGFAPLREPDFDRSGRRGVSVQIERAARCS